GHDTGPEAGRAVSGLILDLAPDRFLSLLLFGFGPNQRVMNQLFLSCRPKAEELQAFSSPFFSLSRSLSFSLSLSHTHCLSFFVCSLHHFLSVSSSFSLSYASLSLSPSPTGC